MMTLKESPSQTAGPYVHIGCVPQTAGLEQRRMGPQLGDTMVSGEAEASISLELQILDGANEPLADALVEIWQAGADGTYNRSNQLSNWGRQGADLESGGVKFETIKPGAPKGQAPHILVWIVARGINIGLTTRIYFPDEDNTSDPTLSLAGDRAQTLIAGVTKTGYSHTIRLQGSEETVFFDV